MIATNVLLSFGLTIITNFSNIVTPSRQQLPTAVDDFVKYGVGVGGSPTDLFIQDKEGFKYWLANGIVYRFSAPNSYSRPEAQESTHLSDFLGKATLNSNQVVTLATNIIGRLTKDWNPVIRQQPIIRQPPPRAGHELPIYWLSWPTTNTLFRHSAILEIDARRGDVTFLELRDEGFDDRVLDEQIRKRCYSPDATASQHKVLAIPATYPRPSKDEVLRGIRSWLWLCDRLNLLPGTQTNLTNVDWEQTFTYNDASVSVKGKVIQVVFKNGAGFNCCEGVAFCHISSDSCFARPSFERSPEDWKAFEGRINRKWEDLAHSLEASLAERVGIPKPLLEPLSAYPAREPPKLESKAVARVVVAWRKWPRRAGEIPIAESRLVFQAEFDLANGRLVWISFSDPVFIRDLARLQNITMSD